MLFTMRKGDFFVENSKSQKNDFSWYTERVTNVLFSSDSIVFQP